MSTLCFLLSRLRQGRALKGEQLLERISNGRRQNRNPDWRIMVPAANPHVLGLIVAQRAVVVVFPTVRVNEGVEVKSGDTMLLHDNGRPSIQLRYCVRWWSASRCSRVGRARLCGGIGHSATKRTWLTQGRSTSSISSVLWLRVRLLRWL